MHLSFFLVYYMFEFSNGLDSTSVTNVYTNYLVKILMLHSLWLKMMFETSKHVPKMQKCGFLLNV